MDFEGKVVQIFPARTGTSKAGNPWTSQDVLFEVQSQSQYPRRTLVSFFNKEDMVRDLVVGAVYTVSIDIDAREFNGRWYNDVRAWRVQPKSVEQPAAAPQAAYVGEVPPMPAEPTYGSKVAATEEVDDLPF